MSLYNNITKDSKLSAVEFAPSTSGNLAFFYIKPRESADEIKAWAESLGQQIITRTTVKGETVLVTRGDKDPSQILAALKEKGDELTLDIPKKQINLWKWRGILSMTGHPLQLASGAMAKGGMDAATIGFATANLAANLTNIIFGAQKRPDENRLHFIKGKINEDLKGELSQGESTLDVLDHRRDLREPAKHKTLGEQAYDFMQQNSVGLGEVGLRYFGGINLVAPPNRWKMGFMAMKEKGLIEGLKVFRNPDKFTLIAGSFWLAGKTIAFAAKTPDPYNDKHESMIDNFRENYAFKVSTATEAMGALTLASDRMFRRKITYPKWSVVPKAMHGKTTPDYLGGIGGLLFALAFVMRFNAPYGVKVTDMEEVNAHLSDTLAKCPPEKIPQLMADNSAYLVEHFKEKDLHFGDVFSSMMLDIYKHHEICPKGTEEIIERVAAAARAHEENKAAQAEKQPEKTEEKSFAGKVERKTGEQGHHSALARHSGSHTDRAEQSVQNIRLSV